MIPARPSAPTCEVCEGACAPFGFAIRYEDEEGKTQTATLWFCREDRVVGEDLWRASKARYAPRVRPPAEPPRQGVLL